MGQGFLLEMILLGMIAGIPLPTEATRVMEVACPSVPAEEVLLETEECEEFKARLTRQGVMARHMVSPSFQGVKSLGVKSLRKPDD